MATEITVKYLRALPAHKRVLLATFVVLFTAMLVLAPFYRHKRGQQRAQQFEKVSTAISDTFEGYTTALKSEDFSIAYRYFGAELQQKTPLQLFREQQLSLGTLTETKRGLTSVQLERTKNSLVRRPVGVVVARMKYGADTKYFIFRFEMESGAWKIVSISQGKGRFEHLVF